MPWHSRGGRSAAPYTIGTIMRWLIIPLLIVSLVSIQVPEASAQAVEIFYSAANANGGAVSCDGISYSSTNFPAPAWWAITAGNVYSQPSLDTVPSTTGDCLSDLRAGITNSNNALGLKVNISSMPAGNYRLYLRHIVAASGQENKNHNVRLEAQDQSSITTGNALGEWSDTSYDITVSDGTLNIEVGGTGQTLSIASFRIYSLVTPTNTPTITPSPTITPTPTATFTPTNTPTPTSTPSAFLTATNRMLTSSNDWLSVFVRIFALIVGLALALLILNMFRKRIVGAIQGSTQTTSNLRPVIKGKRKRR